MLIILRNFGMKSGKVNQSKIALKEDGAIQFETTKNVNTCKDFYFDLAGNLVKRLPVALNKFSKNCHNFELCDATLGTIKKI